MNIETIQILLLLPTPVNSALYQILIRPEFIPESIFKLPNCFTVSFLWISQSIKQSQCIS